MAIVLQYLTAARVSEIVGKYALTPNDFEVTKYQDPEGRYDEPVLLFTLRTAKRQGREKIVALPLNPAYEPLSQPLLDYFEERKTKKIKRAFPFLTRTHQNEAEHLFKGLSYDIERYGKGNSVRHQKPMLTHAMRHYRATELVMKYGFDSIDLAIFLGWTMATAQGLGIADRYITYQWQRYFPKLLK